MQGASRLRETKKKTAWGILVIRVIFNTLGVVSNLSDLGFADISLNGSLEGMSSKLKLSIEELLANGLKASHEHENITLVQ